MMASYIRATAQLLLAAGAFTCFARGSISSRHGKEVSHHHRTLQAIDKQAASYHAQAAWKNKDLSPAPPGTTTEVPVGDGTQYLTDPGDKPRFFSETVPVSAVHGRRRLQESTCTGGESSITVSSTLFPLLEGCLPLTEVSTFEVAYVSDTGFVGYEDMTVFSRSVYDSEPPRWGAFFHETARDNYSLGCWSFEYAEDVGPSEATWMCDSDGDGLVDIFADEELSISCGCSTSTSATSTSTVVPAPTASPVTPAPTPSAYGVCGEGGSILIASVSLPEVAGCLLSTTEVRNDMTLYTMSGTDDVGQLWMYALDVTRDDSSAGIAWALVYMESIYIVGGQQIHCLSVQDADAFLPWDVLAWECYEDGTTSAATITLSSDSSLAIDVGCGCSASPSPTAPSPVSSPASSTTAPAVSPSSSTASPAISPVFLRTPTPVAPTMAGDSDDATSDGDDDGMSTSVTCTGDGSFSITASAAPDLEGCFDEISSFGADDTVVYTVSGTSDTAEIVVTPIESDSGDFNWHITWMPLGADSSLDSQTYCISEEPSTEVDPGSASWTCDFTGDGKTFSLATEEDISIACGTCTVMEDASTASQQVIGVIPACVSGMVAVSSAFGALYLD